MTRCEWCGKEADYLASGEARVSGEVDGNGVHVKIQTSPGKKRVIARVCTPCQETLHKNAGLLIKRLEQAKEGGS